MHSFDRAHPLLLVGSEYANLITAIELVHLGPAGVPAAVKTQLGWAPQGTDGLLQHQVRTQQCLWASVGSARDYIYQHVEHLWQLNVLAYQSEKLVMRFRQDQEVVETLEAKTLVMFHTMPPPSFRSEAHHP